MVYHKLIGRIQTFRNHPRYAFMFENANIGGDTMAEILAHLFRLPPQGKPMTIMQLAGFPAEVVDSVVSVLCRWRSTSGCGAMASPRCCSSARKRTATAPADKQIGFGPTRRALARIAKGRPQIRRVPRPGDAAAGGNRPDHRVAVPTLFVMRLVERPRPGPDPLGGVRRGR